MGAGNKTFHLRKAVGLKLTTVLDYTAKVAALYCQHAATHTCIYSSNKVTVAALQRLNTVSTKSSHSDLQLLWKTDRKQHFSVIIPSILQQNVENGQQMYHL